MTTEKHFYISIPSYDIYNRPVRAETASKAKYIYWLRFCDVLNLSFFDFLRIAKVSR